MKIGFASDHRGYKLKEQLKEELLKRNYEVVDYGTDSEESTDYPDYAFKLGENIVNKNADFGVAICGSGIGISIACNKVKGIRCAKVDNAKEAKHTREDNDANILALNGAMPVYRAKDIVDVFFSTDFSKLEKHIRRINQISDYESKVETDNKLKFQRPKKEKQEDE